MAVTVSVKKEFEEIRVGCSARPQDFLAVKDFGIAPGSAYISIRENGVECTIKIEKENAEKFANYLLEWVTS